MLLCYYVIMLLCVHTSMLLYYYSQFRSRPREPIYSIIMYYYVLLYMYKKHPLYEIAFRDSMSLESLSEVSDLL